MAQRLRPVKHQSTIEAIATELARRPMQLVKVPGQPAIRSTSALTGSRRRGSPGGTCPAIVATKATNDYRRSTTLG